MVTENFNRGSLNSNSRNIKEAPFSIKKEYYEENKEEKMLQSIGSDSLSHDDEQSLTETTLSSSKNHQDVTCTTENFDDVIQNKRENLSPRHDANVDSSTNISYSDYLHGQPIVPLELYPMAGLRLADAQTINAAIVRSKIAATALHEMNRERFSYMVAVNSYKHQLASTLTRAIDENGQTLQLTAQKNLPDFKKFETEFIQNFAVVKVRPRYSARWEFMKRSSYYHRHEQVSEKELWQEYLAFLDDALPANDESSQAVKERSFQRMKRTVPRLEDSGLHILKEYEVMFRDGIYNVKTGQFNPIKQDEHIFCFNIFSIEIEYGNGTATSPEVFDAFLDEILDGNERAHHGVYQMIGSILTPMSCIKKCYLLQGKSGSGKTTLVEYIKKLMPYEDTHDMANLAGIADDVLSKRKQPFRLMNVKELGTNKLSSKQIVNIKAYADGSSDMPGTASFKIILTTNHKVTTGDGGVIEIALKNRLMVIPFPKALNLDNVDPRVVSLEDIYFDQERRAIIIKALQAYSEVLNGDGEFCCDFEVNAVVDEAEKPDDHLSEDEKQFIKSGLPTEETSMPQILAEIFDTAFIVTDDVNSNMTTKVIMSAVNRIRPDILANEATTGRRLQQHFGERLKTGRPNGITAYNLAFAGSKAEITSIATK